MVCLSPVDVLPGDEHDHQEYLDTVMRYSYNVCSVLTRNCNVLRKTDTTLNDVVVDVMPSNL